MPNANKIETVFGVVLSREEHEEAVEVLEKAFDALHGSDIETMKAMRYFLEKIKGAVQCPTKGFELSVDPPFERETFAAFSIVPAIGLEGEDAALNMKRIQATVALEEATSAMITPDFEINGMNIARFLTNPQARRDSRVKDGAMVGLQVAGMVDSICIADFLAGKRKDLLTVHVVED